MIMDDLVSVQIYCPDLSLYEKFNEIYRTYFTKNFPARAFMFCPAPPRRPLRNQGIAVRQLVGASAMVERHERSRHCGKDPGLRRG